MKLTKTSRLILTLGILVITFASLGVARSQQVNEQKQVSENLSMTQLRLSKLQLNDLYSQQAGLEAQLNQAASQLETARSMLAQPNESITISDEVFSIARACGVEVTEISSSSLTPKALEQISCSMLPLTTTARGDVPNLISFIIKLNNDFTTGTVTSAQIAIPEATDNVTGDMTDNATASAAADTRPLARIQLVIYSYDGK